MARSIRVPFWSLTSFSGKLDTVLICFGDHPFMANLNDGEISIPCDDTNKKTLLFSEPLLLLFKTQNTEIEIMLRGHASGARTFGKVLSCSLSSPLK